MDVAKTARQTRRPPAGHHVRADPLPRDAQRLGLLDRDDPRLAAEQGAPLSGRLRVHRRSMVPTGVSTAGLVHRAG